MKTEYKHIINVNSRDVIRNWIIKISDIRRMLIHNSIGDKKDDGTYIEIRYNSTDNYDNDKEYGCDILVYNQNNVVSMFYKMLLCIQKCKKPNEDYMIILDNDVYLLSETEIKF